MFMPPYLLFNVFSCFLRIISPMVFMRKSNHFVMRKLSSCAGVFPLRSSFVSCTVAHGLSFLSVFLLALDESCRNCSCFNCILLCLFDDLPVVREDVGLRSHPRNHGIVHCLHVQIRAPRIFVPVTVNPCAIWDRKEYPHPFPVPPCPTHF